MKVIHENNTQFVILKNILTGKRLLQSGDRSLPSLHQPNINCPFYFHSLFAVLFLYTAVFSNLDK